MVGSIRRPITIGFPTPESQGSVANAPQSVCTESTRALPHPISMPQGSSLIRKAVAEDLKVGLICADRDGNRIRIDRVDHETGMLACHFLNDELRVQEGVRETSIDAFLAEVWYAAAPGTKL
jgi:hypothetical protein